MIFKINMIAHQKRILGFAAGLFTLWFILSGHTTTLFLLFGASSCALVIWLSVRMKLSDREGLPTHLGWAFFPYLGWLVKEVFFCNIQVARIILHPKLPVSPALFLAPAPQKTDLGRVIFANSITLTPGTISIDIPGQGESILVHALCDKMTWGEDGCEMDARICGLGA